MEEEIAPRKTCLVMEEEIDRIRYNIRDSHECKRSSQDDSENKQEERRNIDNNRHHRVRRRLFSDDDNKDDPQERENINNRLLEERRIQLEEAKKRWDFDFVRGEPVAQPINYEWVKLDEQGNEILESREINEKE